MNRESAKALVWTAGIVIILALFMMSPSGAFALLILAAIFAVIPAAFATEKIRLIAVVLLIVSIALAINFYPVFKQEQLRYAQRAHSKAQK